MFTTITSIDIFFIIFSILSFISTVMIIQTSKIIYSVLYLIFFFINVACLLLLIKIEFLSILIILVYISAIAIFFLFIIMTVNIKTTGPNLDETPSIDKPFIAFLGLLFSFESFFFYKESFNFDWLLYNPNKFNQKKIDIFYNEFIPDEDKSIIDNVFIDKFIIPIQKKELELPVDFSNIYSNFEFHSIFYNLFLIELLTVGLILLVSLLGIVVLASTNRGKFLNKTSIKKNFIFLLK